jgi:hypothetical protein
VLRAPPAAGATWPTATKRHPPGASNHSSITWRRSRPRWLRWENGRVR